MSSTPNKTSEHADRLPCRGCTPDCANRTTCNGTPWRSDYQSPLAQGKSPRH